MGGEVVSTVKRVCELETRLGVVYDFFFQVMGDQPSLNVLKVKI